MKYIILAAIPEELPTLNKNDNVFFTGLGKINAAMSVTKHIIQSQPEIIYNYGTAGSTKDIKGLVECGTFIQRDIDCTPLGFEKFQTPFEPDDDILLRSTTHDMVPNLLTCSTGDNFVTDDLDHEADVVDMEAYAIAKVCKKFDVSFRCFKYISDKTNQDSSNDWINCNFEDGENLFIKKMIELNVFDSV